MKIDDIRLKDIWNNGVSRTIIDELIKQIRINSNCTENEILSKQVLRSEGRGKQFFEDLKPKKKKKDLNVEIELAKESVRQNIAN